MRLSEKTIELNICAQINQNLQRQVLWFGLTQAQEAISGFDAATRLNGRLILFQFKASNITMVRTGARRFFLEHHQLQALINRVRGYRRSVFYVFPLIGDTHELQRMGGDFYNNTWLLDVANLPNPFPPPTANTIPVRPRANGYHYADVLPPIVTIHSDPVKSKIESLKNVVESNFAGADGLNSLLFNNENNYTKALKFIEPFKKNSKMAIIY
jgi:hypothetical protein